MLSLRKLKNKAMRSVRNPFLLRAGVSAFRDGRRQARTESVRSQRGTFLSARGRSRHLRVILWPEDASDADPTEEIHVSWQATRRESKTKSRGRHDLSVGKHPIHGAGSP